MHSILDVAGLDGLLGSLRERGYTVVGPTVRDGAIVYDEIDSADALPAGWTETQEAGSYRLERRDDEARFGYASGPSSWKRFLFPPRLRLWRTGPELEVEEEELPDRPLAFVGVRPCELAAIAVQDRVLLGDRDYRSRRERLFTVAVNCHEPGGTCFCVSMGTGPTAREGYDVLLTELAGPRYLAEAGSYRGAEVLASLDGDEPTEDDRRESAEQAARAAEGMGRSLDTYGIRDLLRDNLEHPVWDRVAERCLTCGNCTMVCPTCFCTTVEDANDLVTGRAERSRVWDSCFSIDYSYIHGGAIRQSPRARYRQWLTHKLSTWHDQFDSSGCVGCGRCITWCPVGIDITQEVAAIRATQKEGDA
jgi:ferredoxin